MHGLNTLKKLNSKEKMRRKIQRLRKSKGVQSQQLGFYLSKYKKMYGESV